jgi:hypothetical protein
VTNHDYFKYYLTYGDSFCSHRFWFNGRLRYYKFVTPSGNIVWEVFGVLLSLWVAVFVGYRVVVSYDLYDDGENRKFKANVNEMRL